MKPSGIQFGDTPFHHVCGSEFERTESGDISCDGCGARFTFAEWDLAQRRQVAEADERHRAVLGLYSRRLSVRFSDAAPWN